jgi:hypothetical protein
MMSARHWSSSLLRLIAYAGPNSYATRTAKIDSSVFLRLLVNELDDIPALGHNVILINPVLAFLIIFTNGREEKLLTIVATTVRVHHRESPPSKYSEAAANQPGSSL